MTNRLMTFYCQNGDKCGYMNCFASSPKIEPFGSGEIALMRSPLIPKRHELEFRSL
jgi:hypothetical protein